VETKFMELETKFKDLETKLEELDNQFREAHSWDQELGTQIKSGKRLEALDS
jgi:hypothetical protein